jgi:hypothetical protein
MAKKPASNANTFAAVEAIGRTLPDVEVATAWGSPALKVRGKMFVCMAIHPSAEPNSLVVMMAIADRDTLIDEEPDTYVRPDALRDIVVGAHRYVSAQRRRAKAPARGKKARG